MPLIKTFGYKRTDNSGCVVEKGRWELTGADTSGVITTDKTPPSGPGTGPSIGEIELFSFTNDIIANDVKVSQVGLSQDQITISAVALDKGTYCLRGKAI